MSRIIFFLPTVTTTLVPITVPLPGGVWHKRVSHEPVLESFRSRVGGSSRLVTRRSKSPSLS